MKNKQQILFQFTILVLLSFCCLFISCTSYGSINVVPFEDKIVLKNLSVEYYEIAENYLELKKYDKAITYYKKSLQIKKNDNKVLFKLAQAYAFSSNWFDSKEIFLKLYNSDKENVSFATSLAYVYAMSGEIDNSIAIYETLVEKNEYNIEILNNYIRLLLDNKNFEKALDVFEKLKKIGPDSQITITLKDLIESNIKKSEETLNDLNDIATEEQNSDLEQPIVINDSEQNEVTE